jgi:hypothetical protein
MLSKEDMSLQNQIKIISEDPDNFGKNALFLNMALSDEEKIDVFMYISDIMFSDNVFSDEEYDLYNKLMDAW